MCKHTPVPWKVARQDFRHTASGVEGTHFWITDEDGNPLPFDTRGSPCAEANAEFIVRACNAYEDLLEACKAALAHAEELREAWQTGALSERDGQGGTRSNRNVEVEGRLRAAVAKA